MRGRGADRGRLDPFELPRVRSSWAAAGWRWRRSPAQPLPRPPASSWAWPVQAAGGEWRRRPGHASAPAASSRAERRGGTGVHVGRESGQECSRQPGLDSRRPFGACGTGELGRRSDADSDTRRRCVRLRLGTRKTHACKGGGPGWRARAAARRSRTAEAPSRGSDAAPGCPRAALSHRAAGGAPSERPQARQRTAVSSSRRRLWAGMRGRHAGQGPPSLRRRGVEGVAARRIQRRPPEAARLRHCWEEAPGRSRCSTWNADAWASLDSPAKPRCASSSRSAEPSDAGGAVARRGRGAVLSARGSRARTEGHGPPSLRHRRRRGGGARRFERCLHPHPRPPGSQGRRRRRANPREIPSSTWNTDDWAAPDFHSKPTVPGARARAAAARQRSALASSRRPPVGRRSRATRTPWPAELAAPEASRGRSAEARAGTQSTAPPHRVDARGPVAGRNPREIPLFHVEHGRTGPAPDVPRGTGTRRIPGPGRSTWNGAVRSIGQIPAVLGGRTLVEA